MSHCDPISHGTANSPEKNKKNQQQAESVETEQGERINKGGRIKRRKQEESEDQVESDARRAVIRASGSDGSAEPGLG